MQGLIGKKIGLTEVFDREGHCVVVTVIQAGPCVVTQRKTVECDGYDAVQMGFGDQKESRLTKAVMGHLRKAGVAPKRVLREFSLEDGEDAKPGDEVTADLFEGVSHVDVTGVTKGRGFQGVVRRYRTAGGLQTHGSTSKRRIGSIGQCELPGRVAKNQKMPGHMGSVRVTQQNLTVVDVDKEKNLLLVRGAIPGPAGAIVLVCKSLKKAKKI